MFLVALETRLLNKEYRSEESECVMTVVSRTYLALAPLFQKLAAAKSEWRKRSDHFSFAPAYRCVSGWFGTTEHPAQTDGDFRVLHEQHFVGDGCSVISMTRKNASFCGDWVSLSVACR